MACDHLCGIVTKRGRCHNRPKDYGNRHIQVSREGWPKTAHHYECTFHFNRYAFSGGPVVIVETPCEVTR